MIIQKGFGRHLRGAIEMKIWLKIGERINDQC